MINDKPIRMSELAQRMLWLDGKPFSLRDYPMHAAIYDGRFRATQFMCGRQVAKSTFLATSMIAESIAIPHFRSLYLSPSKEQTLIFSNSRLGKVLSYSPLVKKHFQSPEHSDRVLHRAYTNGSENYLSYAMDDPDRARGITADRVLYDEFQDMLYEAVVPVVNKSMRSSSYKFETYAGTPKTMESSIQFLWERSTQGEWIMKCTSCNSYNCVMSEKSIGKEGPICLKCGKNLNPRLGFWLDMQKQSPDPKHRLVKGFHIPQPIMPDSIPWLWTPGAPEYEKARDNWNDILFSLENEPPAKFRNEVLGVSDAIGRRLLSLDELKALCTGPSISAKPDNTKNMKGVNCVVAGIDWSGGGTSGASRTVVHIWGWDQLNQKLRTLNFRIFPSSNPVADIKEIIAMLQAYNPACIVGDAGEGALPNSMLKDHFGAHRVWQVQYSGTAAKPWSWDGVDKYVVARTCMVDNFLIFLKQGRAVYPPYEEIKEPIKDILNEYEEVTTNGKKVWRHSPSLPDDALHAQLFGWLAWKLHFNQLTFYDNGNGGRRQM